MISALNNCDYKTNFTSIVPVKVLVDGKETYLNKYVSPACKQLSSVLIGPVKEKNIKAINILKQFAQHDPDYNFLNGLYGFPKKCKKKKVKPSDYFAHIFSGLGHFFATGIHAEILREKGLVIGLIQQDCKINNINSSLDLSFAKQEYFGIIRRFINSKKLRLTESYNSATGQKQGEPVTLVINMKSNGKYDKTTFKMEIDSIEFQKA